MAPRRKGRRFAGNKKLAQKPGGKKPSAAAPRNGDDSDGSCSRSCSGSSGSGGSAASSSESCSDEDSAREYKHGGYHPVQPFQLYSGRYRVLSKLGAGAFSTVWLCADESTASEESGPDLVAMKVCKSKKSVSEQALDEISLLEQLKVGAGSEHVTQMRGHFWHSGPNGRHKCVVFEVMGENLLALVKFYDYNGLPLEWVRRISRHTLLGLEYIHSKGVLHTDVKLENVLLQRHDLALLQEEARAAHSAFAAHNVLAAASGALTKNQKKRLKKKQKAKAAKEEAAEDSDGEADEAGGNPSAAASMPRPPPPVRQRERFADLQVDQISAKLADFGNGCFENRKVTDDIQTRQYRSPEVILGMQWDHTADLWSAACMFFELSTGDFLFDPRTGEDWSRDEDHIALMVELLGGHPPKHWVQTGRYFRELFTGAGKLRNIKKLKYWELSDVLMEKYKRSSEDAEEFSSFLLPMLRWEPSSRASATEALRHKFVAQESHAQADPTAPGATCASESATEGPGQASPRGDQARAADPAATAISAENGEAGASAESAAEVSPVPDVEAKSSTEGAIAVREKAAEDEVDGAADGVVTPSTTEPPLPEDPGSAASPDSAGSGDADVGASDTTADAVPRPECEAEPLESTVSQSAPGDVPEVTVALTAEASVEHVVLVDTTEDAVEAAEAAEAEAQTPAGGKKKKKKNKKKG